eukprot:CAMPEP_0194755232 /NCGR_PEP_ID=MMETSP0323_2-20130528/9125_1 /TAXON_ID=2866 ORGANISM="Crypthecodinium cohnii, Strain Seligo" /NCGR_SAMPLE_ID=MMETSP0323_2 /ASSEMBLY_ACC=CAM_ASM_000346 /LENGTH=129 /DNA_ID=CAMNT_0039674189 /DNA_START=52 /DNA_END=441 /DNA_ORIENTATION=-
MTSGDVRGNPAGSCRQSIPSTFPAMHCKQLPALLVEPVWNPRLQGSGPMQDFGIFQGPRAMVLVVPQPVHIPGLIQPFDLVVQQKQQGRLRPMPPEGSVRVLPGPPIDLACEVPFFPSLQVQHENASVE